MKFKKNKKKIVFYSATTPTAFLYKIALMLKKNNYETILFTTCEKDMFDYTFYKRVFDRIIYSNFRLKISNLKSPLYLIKRTPYLLNFIIHLKRIKPYAIIGIAGNNWQLSLAHKYFLKKHPFIYSPYDILSHFFSSREEALKSEIAPRPAEMDAEKYLFENSDGIMHKGGVDELKPINGRIFKKINLPNLQLNFSPYCSKEFKVPINRDKISKKDKEIHIVYTGYIANNPESAEIFKGYFRDIIRQKMHMHVYLIVGHVSKKEEAEYIRNLFESFKGEEYLHLHKSLDPKKIVEEISKYDFALWMAYESNKNNIEAIYSVGNKISTYLEAGLPIIYNKNSVYLDKILKSYGLEISFTRENLKRIRQKLEKLDYERLIQGLERARKDFDMDKNFPRLNELISLVVAKKNKNKSLPQIL